MIGSKGFGHCLKAASTMAQGNFAGQQGQCKKKKPKQSRTDWIRVWLHNSAQLDIYAENAVPFNKPFVTNFFQR